MINDDDRGKIGQVKHWRLEKRDAAGEVFEVVEGGVGAPARVTFRRPGEPPQSYADLPYRGDKP